MAVSLPTAADVRKAREQAATSAAERAEVARTPLLAALGAGDYAVAAMTRAVTGASRAVAEAGVRSRAEVPQRLSADELRRLLDELRSQVEKTYGEFAERGEQAWDRIRSQPHLQQFTAAVEAYTDKLDAQVDHLVDEARDAGEKALGTFSRQTRFTGERFARSTERFAADAARTVDAVTGKASEAVAEAGSEVAENITEAADEAAQDTRSATRKAANRTTPTVTPRTAAARNAARKPAVRRPGS